MRRNILREIFYRDILKQLKGAKTIIDIGAGNSVYKYIFAKRKIHFYEFVNKVGDFKVDPIDLYPENKNVIKMDYRDIKKEYDVFFSSHFIEHIDDPIEFIEKAKKYCKKYIVTITDKESRTFWDEPTHKRPHTIKSIKSLYICYGFKPIKTYNLGKTFCVIGRKIRLKE